MSASSLSSVSKAETLEEMGEFWDTHDFTEHDPGGPDVEFEVRCSVPLDVNLLESVEGVARKRGISVETLVNLWVSEKVAEQRTVAAG